MVGDFYWMVKSSHAGSMSKEVKVLLGSHSTSKSPKVHKGAQITLNMLGLPGTSFKKEKIWNFNIKILQLKKESTERTLAQGSSMSKGRVLTVKINVSALIAQIFTRAPTVVLLQKVKKELQDLNLCPKNNFPPKGIFNI